MVDLASYRKRRNVVVWFSRGFTCPFCRIYTDGIRSNYDALPERRDRGHSGGAESSGERATRLAITKTIVESVGGRISVESLEGAGTTFAVALPVAQPR
jgi:sensor histidine kinase regulating citrate/malate metabolism